MMVAAMERPIPRPPAGSPAAGLPAGRHRTLVLLLAATSGALDAVGFLGLGGVFASVMTGNLVLLGLGAGTRDGGLAARAVVAVGAYVVGVAAGVRVAGGSEPARAPRWTGRMQMVVVVEVVLVVALTVGWELTRGGPSSATDLVLLVPAALAMGLQSAVMRASTGAGVSTTYLTGTLTGVVSALVEGRPLRSEWTGTGVLVAALAGAAVAGVTLTGWARGAPLVPLVAVSAASVLGRDLVRTHGRSVHRDERDAGPDGDLSPD